MIDQAISVEKLSKRYRLGAREQPRRTLRETLAHAVSSPWRRLRSCHGGTLPSTRTDLLWALKNVSFTVARGEVIGIIGRNGAGKSTLLKILSRITEPTEGHADIHGRVGSLLEVGTGFHPDLTGRENIFLNGAILGMKRSEIRRKFDAIVGFAEVEEFVDTPVKHYSSGMYVRLAFAVAAHLEPEILLVDEVLAVGDMAFQQKCLGKMGDISRGGRTVVLVSHNMPSIINLCRRALLIQSGSVVADGPPAAVVQEYLSAVCSADGEIVWPDPEQAPGNARVRLHAVRIRQDETEPPSADVDIAREVQVEIRYWNLHEGARLYSGLWLKDGLGTFVLASANHRSMNASEDPWYGRPHPRGLFQSMCRIPGNFLNEGRYRITAILGQLPDTGNPIVCEESVLSFQAHDTGAMRQEFYGSWAGPVIRPRLPWHTDYLGAA